MTETNLYYRRKGDKIVIEKKVSGRTIYLMQLPSPDKLLEILKRARRLSKDKKQSSCRAGKAS